VRSAHLQCPCFSPKWDNKVAQGRPEVHKNKFVTKSASFKLPMVLALAAKGIQCFDCPYYAASNGDIPRSFDCLALFDHYINNGQFEGRPFRCDSPVSTSVNLSWQAIEENKVQKRQGVHVSRAVVLM
jgi:hypothetical protein